MPKLKRIRWLFIIYGFGWYYVNYAQIEVTGHVSYFVELKQTIYSVSLLSSTFFEWSHLFGYL